MHFRKLCLCLLITQSIKYTQSAVIDTDYTDLASPDFSSCDEIYGQDLNAQDCQRAINKLPNDAPSDIKPGPLLPRFSRTMADPRFRLPMGREFGECRVDVSLVPGRQSDVSLWSLVRFRANAIITKCIIEHDGIGGFQMAGEKAGIKITLYSDSGYVGINLSNETADMSSNSDLLIHSGESAGSTS